MNIFNEWLDILLFKKKPADIAGTSLVQGLKHLAIASVIYGLLSGILSYLTAEQVAAASGMPAGIMGAVMGPIAIVGSIIVTPILAVIAIVIVGVILHIFSLIVGGKGGLGNYIGVLALIDAALTGTAMLVIAVIGIIIALAGASIVAMSIVALLGMLVGLWQLVLWVLATQAVQKLSLGRALIAVIVIPLAIGAILTIVLAAVFIAFITSIAGGMGGFPAV